MRKGTVEESKMETYLEMWESYKPKSYQPKWKGKMACLLCAAVLGGSAYVAETTKPKEYLSAREKAVVAINNNELAESIAQKKVMKLASPENNLQNEMEEAESNPNHILESRSLTKIVSNNVLNPAGEAVPISSNTITMGNVEVIADYKTEETSGNMKEEIKGSKSGEIGGNVIEEIKDSKSEEAGGDVIEEIKDSESEKTSETDTEVASPFLIDEDGMLSGINIDELDCSTGVLELPTENCVGIRSNVFAGGITGIYEVYIPANISLIEAGAFDGLSDLFDITVEDGNVNYSSIDGVLYGEQGTLLLAFPAGRTGGYIVPVQTRKIAAGAFYQTGLSVIDIRDCGELEIEDEEAMQLVR